MTLNNELLAEVTVFRDVLPTGPFLVLWVEATVMAFLLDGVSQNEADTFISVLSQNAFCTIWEKKKPSNLLRIALSMAFLHMMFSAWLSTHWLISFFFLASEKE